MPGDVLTGDEIAEATKAMEDASRQGNIPQESPTGDTPRGPGVTVGVGETFPWKRAWWRVVAVCKFRDREGKEQQGVVIAPEKFTGADKRQKRRK